MFQGLTSPCSQYENIALPLLLRKDKNIMDCLNARDEISLGTQSQILWKTLLIREPLLISV